MEVIPVLKLPTCKCFLKQGIVVHDHGIYQSYDHETPNDLARIGTLQNALGSIESCTTLPPLALSPIS